MGLWCAQAVSLKPLKGNTYERKKLDSSNPARNTPTHPDVQPCRIIYDEDVIVRTGGSLKTHLGGK